MRYADSKEYKKFIWTFLEGLYKTYCYFTLKETGQLPTETQAVIARTIKSMWAEFEKENAGFIESAYEKARKSAGEHIRWLIKGPVEEQEENEEERIECERSAPALRRWWDNDLKEIFEYHFEENFKTELKNLLENFRRAVEERLMQSGVINQSLPPSPKM